MAVNYTNFVPLTLTLGILKSMMETFSHYHPLVMQNPLLLFSLKNYSTVVVQYMEITSIHLFC